MRNNTKNLVVLDVRTPDEYTEWHVASSVNIDFLAPTFTDRISKLDKNLTYKLYCRSGNRSGKAAATMRDLGFHDVENLGTLSEASLALGRPCEK